MYDLDLEASMSVDMKFPPPFTIVEDRDYNKDNAFLVEDDNSVKTTTTTTQSQGKPPRHASSLRHSLSSTRLLLAAADLVCNFIILLQSSLSTSLFALSFFTIYMYIFTFIN